MVIYNIRGATMDCNVVANSSNLGRLLKSEVFKDGKVGIFHMTNIFKGQDYVELQVYGEGVVNIPGNKLDDMIAALGVVNTQIKKSEEGSDGN
jgi:hypothetical protein